MTILRAGRRLILAALCLGVFGGWFLAGVSSAHAQSSTDTLVVVDQPPRIVGGMDALQERATLPPEARQKGLEGRVFVQFVVTTEGRAVDLKVITGENEILREAAKQAIRETEFIPGRHEGKLVNVVMSVPVTFRDNA